jgi:hypothetical protein
MKLFIRPKKKYWKKNIYRFDQNYNDSQNSFWQNEIIRTYSNHRLAYISWETVEKLRLKYGDI